MKHVVTCNAGSQTPIYEGICSCPRPAMTPKDELSKRLRATRDHADTWWVSLCEEAADALDEQGKRIAEYQKIDATGAALVRSLSEKNAELEKDARRYRWLRSDATIGLWRAWPLLDPPHFDEAVDNELARKAALAETERSETGGER